MFPSNPSMMPMGPSGGTLMGPPVAGSSPQSKGLGGMFGGDAVGRRGFKNFMSSTSSGAVSRGGMLPGGAPSMMPSAPPGGMPMPVAPPMGGSPMMAPPIGGMGPMGPMGPQPMNPRPMGMGPMGQPPMGPMQPAMQRPMQRPMGFADGGSVPMRTEIRGMPHDLSYITADEAEILELLGGTGERGPGGVRAYPPVNEGGSTGTSDRGSFDDEPSRDYSEPSRDYGGYDPVGSIDGGQFDSGGIDTSPSYSGGGFDSDDWGASDDEWGARDYGGASTYDPIGSTVGSQFDSGDDYDFGPVYGGDDRDSGGSFFSDEDSVFSQPVVSSPSVSFDRDDRADIYDFGGDIYRDADVGGSAVGGSAQRSPSSGFAPESGVGLGPSSRALEVTRGVSPESDVDLGIGSSVTGSLGSLAGDDLLDLLGDVDSDRVFAPGTQVAEMTGAPTYTLDELVKMGPLYEGGSPVLSPDIAERYAADVAAASAAPVSLESSLRPQARPEGFVDRVDPIVTSVRPEVPDVFPSDVSLIQETGVPLAPSLTNMPDEAMLPSGSMPSTLPYDPVIDSSDSTVRAVTRGLLEDEALRDVARNAPVEIYEPPASLASSAALMEVGTDPFAGLDDSVPKAGTFGIEPGGDLLRPPASAGDAYSDEVREALIPAGQAAYEKPLADVRSQSGVALRPQTEDMDELMADIENYLNGVPSSAPVPPDAVVTPNGAIVTGITEDEPVPASMVDNVIYGFDPTQKTFIEYKEKKARESALPESTFDDDDLGLPSGPVPSLAPSVRPTARPERNAAVVDQIQTAIEKGYPMDDQRIARVAKETGVSRDIISSISDAMGADPNGLERSLRPQARPESTTTDDLLAAETTEPVNPATVVDFAQGAFTPEAVTSSTKADPTKAEVAAEMERSGLSYEDAYKKLTAERSALGQFGTGVLELLGNAFFPGAGTAGVGALEKQRERQAEEIAYDISIGGEPVYNKNGDLIGVVDLAGVYNGVTYGTGFDADGNRLGDDYQESIRDAIPSTEDNLFSDGADERDCPEGYTFDRILRQCVPVEEAGDTGDGEGDGDDTDGGGSDGSDGYSLTPIQQPEFYTQYRSGGPVMSSVDRFMASFG